MDYTLYVPNCILSIILNDFLSFPYNYICFMVCKRWKILFDKKRYKSIIFTEEFSFCGDLNILKWLKEYNFKITKRSLYNASLNGDLNIIIWLISNYSDKKNKIFCKKSICEAA